MVVVVILRQAGTGGLVENADGVGLTGGFQVGDDALVQELQVIAAGGGPIGVQIIGQEVARVERGGAFERCGLGERQGEGRFAIEQVGVDADQRIGSEADEVLFGMDVAGRGATGELRLQDTGGSVDHGGEAGDTGLVVGVRPQGFDHLFAVHFPSRGEGQMLQQRFRLLVGPPGVLDQMPANNHPELAQ